MEEPQESRDSPQPRRRRRFGLPAGAGIFAGGLAIGIVLAGLGLGLAQTGSPSPTPSSGAPLPGHKGPFGRGGLGGHFGFFGALHGEFTVPAPSGGYQTLAMQRGQVTAVSASSITVKSDDGFSRTYSVDGNTVVAAGDNGIADVKTGNAVRILAVVSGGKARAVQILDATTVGRSRGTWLPRYHEAEPSPSASTA
jgi:hypothetical protein